MRFLKCCGVMVALWLALSFLLTGCGPEEDSRETEGASEQQTEESPAYKFPEGIVFVSNGDGTCYVDGVCDPVGEKEMKLVIPEVSPDGDTVVEIRSLGTMGNNLPRIILKEDFELILEKIRDYYDYDSSESAKFFYGRFAAYWQLKTMDMIEAADVTEEERIQLREELLSYFPECAVCDVYVLDTMARRVEIERLETTLAEICPEYTPLRRWLDEKKVSDTAEAQGISNSHAAALIEEQPYPEIHPSAFTEIVLPKTVKKIGDRAFDYCYRVTSLEIPEGVTEIGGFAFVGCSGITSLIIPEGVTKIGVSIFNDCESLEALYIPGSVKELNCENEEGHHIVPGNSPVTIYYAGTEEEWVAIGGDKWVERNQRIVFNSVPEN